MLYYTKQPSSTLPLERKKGLNHLPTSQSISGDFTAQWDTALALPELDNVAFQVYEFPNQVMPAAFRAQTISLKQGRSLFETVKSNQTKTF